jgi:RecA-family ATPase
MKEDANSILVEHGVDALRTRFDVAVQNGPTGDPVPAAPERRPNGATAAPIATPLPVVCAASLAGKDVPHRSWIVQDMIPDRTVTLVSGDGGVGKSLLLAQLAVAVTTGGEWIGTCPVQGPVVFVSAEDDLDELHRRLAVIAHAKGLDLAALVDLHFVTLAGRDAVMGAPDGKTGIVKETPLWRELVAIVGRIRPRLVILDTLADVFAGNEIARQEARQFIGLLRGLAIAEETAVALLAHPSLSGMASGSGTSGSTAWSNSVRSRLYLETIKDDDGKEIDADFRVLRTKKSNYGPTGSEIRLRWSNGCFVRETPAGGFDKLVADTKAERVFLELLGKLSAQGRDVSSKPSQSYAPVVFEKHPNAEGIRKREFASAMERLLMAGRILVEPVGPASRRTSRLVLSPPKTEE